MPVIPDTREQVADPGSAYQVVAMMEGVVQRGTGTAVKAVGKPIAGKTGTTNDFHDAWFVGFTPDLAAGVYVGFDEPDSLGKGETGCVVAAPIFRDFMIAALASTPATDFRIPPGMRLYRVSAATGLPIRATGRRSGRRTSPAPSRARTAISTPRAPMARMARRQTRPRLPKAATRLPPPLRPAPSRMAAVLCCRRAALPPAAPAVYINSTEIDGRSEACAPKSRRRPTTSGSRWRC